MIYVAHPYASASSPSSSPCKSADSKSRPQRPKIITSSSSPGSFLDAAYTGESTRSPSPITFARASVISHLHRSPLSSTSTNHSDVDSVRIPMRKKDEKKDRRRGLLATERVTHAGLDALLRVPEAASARAAPQPRIPHVQLVRSPTNLSVTPSIVQRTSPCTTLCNGDESDGSAGSSTRTLTPRAVSPTPSSGSGSAPSTPGQPRTPVSVSFGHEFSYPVVAPLSICKANRTPSPSPPSKLPALPSSSPSSLSRSKENSNANGDVSLKRRGSRGRFSVRTSSIPRAEHLFALEIDTAAAQSLDSSHELPTLTGVLEEFEREALKIPPVPSLPLDSRATPGKMIKEKNDQDENESEWIDIPEDDSLEDAEYYRVDIASHLQLFSASSSFPPISRMPSYARHHRGGSSSSFSSMTRWHLPPARPDSMPPPPHFFSSFSFSNAGKEVGESAPSLPPLPPLPALAEGVHFHTLRRPSTSSLASIASSRSTRSNGSTSSMNKRRNARNSRQSIARRSAALGVGRRRSSNVSRANRPLPPLPGAANQEVQRRGPSPTLDPTYIELAQESQKQPRPRPPPRFSIPVGVDEEDDFPEDVAAAEVETGSSIKTSMASVIEEDEDENGLIDPFVLDRFPVVNASATSLVTHNDSGVDLFITPRRSGCSMETDVHLSPLTCSPSSLNQQFSPQPQPFFLVPESPAPVSSCGGSSNDSFDAESLYSSYAAFSPGSNSNGSDNSSVAFSRNFDNVTQRDDAQSIYLDTSGRPLQSRWSVSTFASAAPPSSARSFFPIPKLVSTVPSRLSARLRAAREKATQQAREREAKEPVVRPFPFFPTPTPPSPKRKTNPGPGKYVPKPELMPLKARAEAEKASMSAKSSPSTTIASPRSSCETVKTSTTSSSSSTASSLASSTKSKESSPNSFKTQFAQYRAHRNSPDHLAHSIPPSSSATSSTFSCSSTSRSLRSQSSTDSLSAFPFTLGGESLTTLGLPSGLDCVAEASGEGRMKNERRDSGLKRKALPTELFA